MRPSTQDEWCSTRAGGGGGVLPRALPAPQIWRFSQAASDGPVRHPPRLVPVLPHRLHPPAGRQHGEPLHVYRQTIVRGVVL